MNYVRDENGHYIDPEIDVIWKDTLEIDKIPADRLDYCNRGFIVLTDERKEMIINFKKTIDTKTAILNVKNEDIIIRTVSRNFLRNSD